jgi:hypothetical protein
MRRISAVLTVLCLIGAKGWGRGVSIAYLTDEG